MAKILYIWKSPYPWDVRVEKICKSLAFNNEVLLAARWGGEPEKSYYDNGFRVTRIGYSSSPNPIKQKLLFPVEWNLIWKKELDKLVAIYNPDVVIHREMFLASIVVKLKRKYGFALVSDIAEFYPFLIEYWEHYNPILKFLAVRFKYYYKLEQMLVRNSNMVWTVTPENSQRLSEYNPNIQEIYNSSYAEPITPIPSPDIRFAYHGFVNTERKLDLFMRAFDEVSSSMPNIKLDIYGDGPTLDQIKSLATHLGNPNIQVHGHYSHTSLPALLARCDIGILPYDRNLHIDHTLSNKFFDYAQNNITILCSDNPPMERLVARFDLGFTYLANDKISLVEAIKRAARYVMDSKGQRTNQAFHQAGFDWASMEQKMQSTILKLSQ